MDEREAMDRLRAADPAVGAQPDDARLGPLVDARRTQGEEPTGAQAPTAAGEPAVPDEFTARRSRRLLPVAAAVVAALAVGSAGYAVGRNVDPAPPTAVPAIHPATDHARLGRAMPEIMAAPTIGYLGGGRMSFTSAGLSSQGGRAEAWAFDGASAYSAQTAARAAEVLGLDGEPRQDEGGGGWMVGAPDGSGPFLHLMPDGMATVSYHDPELYSFIEDVAPVPLPAPDGAVEPGTLSRGAGTSGDVDVPGTEPTAVGPAPEADAPELLEPTDAPTGEPLPDLPVPTAEPTAVEPDGQSPEGPADTLYEVLAALGLDPDAAEYETGDHWSGDELSIVTAHLVVDGERVGTTWHAEVVDGTIYSFSGPLAPVVGLGEYDVVGPATAVERLSDPRFGHADHRIVADAAPMTAPEVMRPWGTPPADPPAPGAAVPWQVREVTITAAETALTMTTTQDGVTLVLPAYSLSDSDGGTWTVVALAEHELAF